MFKWKIREFMRHNCYLEYSDIHLYIHDNRYQILVLFTIHIRASGFTISSKMQESHKRRFRDKGDI